VVVDYHHRTSLLHPHVHRPRPRLRHHHRYPRTRRHHDLDGVRARRSKTLRGGSGHLRALLSGSGRRRGLWLRLLQVIVEPEEAVYDRLEVG